MDWNKLQHTLFALDPTDPAEDLRKLKESAGAVANVAPTIDYVVESAQVKEGSLQMDRNYSVADFAALAGVTLTEAQKKGSAGQLKGKEAIKKLPSGTTKNATRDKLVGEDAVDAFKAGRDNYNSLDAITKGVNAMDGKPSAEKLAPKGTSTQKEANGINPKLSAQLVPYEAQLTSVLKGLKSKAKFEEFLNMWAPKSEGQNLKVPASKPRNPNWRDIEALRKSGAMGVHADKKRDVKMGKEKHKKAIANESIKQMLYRKLNESK